MGHVQLNPVHGADVGGAAACLNCTCEHPQWCSVVRVSHNCLALHVSAFVMYCPQGLWEKRYAFKRCTALCYSCVILLLVFIIMIAYVENVIT